MAQAQSYGAVTEADGGTSRDLQREETRERILNAAREVFAEQGFLGASTREIARRANANQGLITYHFRTKKDLWRAAVDSMFNELDGRLTPHLQAVGAKVRRQDARAAIGEYVRFVAKYPELFYVMVDEGRIDDERLRWLVDTHIKPRYETIAAGLLKVISLNKAYLPHAFYTLAGAASLIFAVAPECRRLTNLDPITDEAVERHAEFVAHLFIPNDPV